MFVGTSRFNKELKPYLIGENSDLAQKKYQFNILAHHSSNLLIDSNDRDPNYPRNDFLIQIPTNQQNVYRLFLENFYCFYDLPNVIVGKNSTFVIGIGFSTYLVQLNEGLYSTASAMASHIQSQIQATDPALATWTCTINPTTKALNINNPAATQFTITGNEKTELTYGVRAGANLSGITGVYIGRVPTLFYSRYFDVMSRELTKFARSDSATDARTTNLLTRAYFPPTDVGTFSFETNNPKPIMYAPNQNIPQIDLRLVDEWGDLLYIPVYSNFNFGLVMQVINNPD